MEDLFNFQQRNHSMPDWREAYKILSVSGRLASRRAIDFSREFWYRLLQDKVVWTCSTPITQAHRCRRCILLARMTKGAAVRENDKMEEHGCEEMAEETKAREMCEGIKYFYEILFVIRMKQLFTIYLQNYAWIDEIFLKKEHFYSIILFSILEINK